MSQLPKDNEADATRAAWRYQIMSGIRLAAILGVVAGISIAQGVVAAPYPIGVALAVIGVVAFFFAPPMLAKKWKAQDRANDAGE
ncbi:hypothetical protein [uncultured Erythrobacter sp.]|uniref:hypothetical protein n=1 Tax=uncultured Erythrobacter sp. TaxID=263913 RepID=UPI0026273309|nr:hypothetical protein [uncultured Erythrobacter sp.]